jgi:hypothetical protein
MPPKGGIQEPICVLLAFLGALALLVGDAAAGLAGRLAGSLALAAAAVLGAVAQISGLNGLDMFHNFTFHKKLAGFSLAQANFYVNHIFHTFHIYRYLCCMYFSGLLF